MVHGKILPGETPIEDISGLKIKGITTRRELNAHEAENILKPTIKYLAQKPSRRLARFDLPWIRKLHREMFGDVWKWAGQFRTCNLNLGVPFQHIEVRLQNLLDDLDFWSRGEMDRIEQAALLHHKAVLIHPFLNGNGRWSRLLANIWLKRHRRSPTAWPEETIGRESIIRKQYLDAIRQADEGDYSLLIDLHKQFTSQTESA